jgi:gliding motility-associated-like protein
MLYFNFNRMRHLATCWIILIASLFSCQRLFSQGCADALTNYVCAGQTQTSEVLYAQYPAFFNLGTFTNVPGDSLNYAQWFSFHTNSSSPPGGVTISVQVNSCNYAGNEQNDLLYMSVYSIAPGGNPCAIATNTSALNATLSSGASYFEYSLPTVLPNRDYIIIVGMFLPPTSNPAELPCGFDLTVSGSALEITATADPPIIYGNQTSTLSVTGQTDNVSVQWSPAQYLDNASSVSPLASVIEPTSFEVSAQVGNCTVTDVVSVSRSGCESALSNPLCADETQTVDSLFANAYSNPCFPASVPSQTLSNTVWYSFHTNELTDETATIQVSILDCDFSTDGDNDFVYAAVYPVAEGQNPCEVSGSLADCAGDNSSFSLTLTNVQPNTDYVVVAGSNHVVQGTNAEDPCSFDVTISGGAVDISAVILPAGTVSISLGEEINLQVNGADSGSSVRWSPSQYVESPTEVTTVAYPEETTVFQVSGTVGECRLLSEVIVTVTDPIEIYNAFSPNGDGTNDSWKIDQIERFEGCQVEVFDRWGQSVFKSVGYERPWDGTFKGRYLPTGPYYYVIELNSLDVTIAPYTGVVSIVH